MGELNKDKGKGQDKHKPAPLDEVDESSKESFPASDPPAWTGGNHKGNNKNKDKN